MLHILLVVKRGDHSRISRSSGLLSFVKITSSVFSPVVLGIGEFLGFGLDDWASSCLEDRLSWNDIALPPCIAEYGEINLRI